MAVCVAFSSVGFLFSLFRAHWSHSVFTVLLNLPAVQETQEMWVQSLSQKMPWRRKWRPTPVLLPREFHGQRSLEGYSPWGCKELVVTEWLNMSVNFYWIYCNSQVFQHKDYGVWWSYLEILSSYMCSLVLIFSCKGEYLHKIFHFSSWFQKWVLQSSIFEFFVFHNFDFP